MITPQNIFTNNLTFGSVLPLNQTYETRLENDSSGKVLYAGLCIIPNGDVDLPIWYILKMGYDSNGFINRIQLPDDNVGFKYVWTDMADYFS